MAGYELNHDQLMKLADIYGEMQGKCLRIEKRIDARNPQNVGNLQELNRRAMDLMQQLRLHCHYAGIEAERGGEGPKRSWLGG